MSLDISGALQASGLKPADKDTLEALINVIDTHASRNRTLVRYYESKAVPKNIGIDTIPENVTVEEHCDWPRKAVTAVSERSRLSGFVFEDDSGDATMDAIVRDNDLIGSYNRHVHSELIHGCMFATVNRTGERCQVRFHTAESAGAIFDDSTGRIGAGLVVASTALTEWSPTVPVPVQLNMHLPGRVVVIRRTAASEWDATDATVPLDRPAMESFAYRPTGLHPFGESRISRTVMSITDDVIRTLQNMAVSSALYSSPQKYLLGLTEDQFWAMNGGSPEDDDEDADLSEDELEQRDAARAARAARSAWTTYITRVLMATADEDGHSPTVGQLQAATPEPYISVLRTYATMFSGVTGVPLNSLGIVQDNPSSAEAINAAREDICICAQDLNDSNGQSLRNVALMAMACAENTSVDGLSDNQRTVMAKFMKPSMPSVVTQATAAESITRSAPWFAQSDEFLRMVGFDEPTIQTLKKFRTLDSANNLLAMFNTGQATPTAVS